ncbi:Uncharacterized protein MLTONO_5478 [Mesorhizobium loti]|nr:Uncharacterized protein MLTONO_5478 [Mesorhizobium loti]BCH26841.1 hypothetical protein MesoLjLb_66260 [Mesorhizobium sp. L-8-3]
MITLPLLKHFAEPLFQSQKLLWIGWRLVSSIIEQRPQGLGNLRIVNPLQREAEFLVAWKQRLGEFGPRIVIQPRDRLAPTLELLRKSAKKTTIDDTGA